MQEQLDSVKSLLLGKGSVKQQIYRKTLDSFGVLKEQARGIAEKLSASVGAEDSSLIFTYKEFGQFEFQLSFASDALVVLMHTNVFDFPENHMIHKSKEGKSDANNAFCGTLYIYNFLADTLKYRRQYDPGYLLARVFINRNGHFWVQGKQRLSFLYNDFGSSVFGAEIAKDIMLIAMQEAINFDLQVPSIEHVQEITLQQKNVQAGMMAVKTGKRLGFDYNPEKD